MTFDTGVGQFPPCSSFYALQKYHNGCVAITEKEIILYSREKKRTTFFRAYIRYPRNKPKREWPKTRYIVI